MLHAQIDITGMLWIAKGLDFVICVKVHKNKKMKKIVIIKIEVDMKHPAREEWEKSKDFVDTEIDDVLDHIRDFTRPYKKESGRSSSKATTYSVDIHNIK